MALTFPSWWKGGFPDAEKVLREMLLPFTSQIEPQPNVLAWLPDDYKDHLPILSVYRVSGIRDPETGVTDLPAVQVGVICETRADSLELMEFVREIVNGYKSATRLECSDGSVAVIKSTLELEGPELTPERVPDLRLVYATFQLNLGKTLDQPSDYRHVVEATVR